jgi:hypothetical protein
MTKWSGDRRHPLANSAVATKAPRESVGLYLSIMSGGARRGMLNFELDRHFSPPSDEIGEVLK